MATVDGVGPLPAALRTVGAPAMFSPSRLKDIDACPIQAFAGPGVEHPLAPSPRALVGSLLHHVAEQLNTGRWGAKTALDPAFDLALATALESAHRRLASAGFGHLVPLRDVMGRVSFDDRVVLAVGWCEDSRPGGDEIPPRPFDPLPMWTAAPGKAAARARAEIRSEARIICPELRVSGQVDRVEAHGDRLRILDYKSGPIRTPDGELRPGLVRQLQAYSLAYETVTGRTAEPFLVRGREHQVPWGPKERKGTRKFLVGLAKDYPEGKALAVEDHARPGPHCDRCRLRPCCAVYLRDAPTVWTEPERAASMPLDTWGELKSVYEEPGEQVGVSVVLRDPVGSRVTIRRLLVGSDLLLQLPIGSHLYVFNLERAEHLLHGEGNRALNLFQLPPRGSSSRCAVGTRVYAEVAPSFPVAPH